MVGESTLGGEKKTNKNGKHKDMVFIWFLAKGFRNYHVLL